MKSADDAETVSVVAYFTLVFSSLYVASIWVGEFSKNLNPSAEVAASSAVAIFLVSAAIVLLHTINISCSTRYFTLARASKLAKAKGRKAWTKRRIRRWAVGNGISLVAGIAISYIIYPLSPVPLIATIVLTGAGVFRYREDIEGVDVRSLAS